jgi:flagellar hook-associated protein 1 FlgK
MIIDALQSAIYGLNVSQQLLNVTAENASNADTAGYTRKTLQVEDQVANGTVVGVTTGQVQRSVDQSLQQSVWSQTSTSAQLSTINSYLGQIQSLYGTATSGSNFSDDLTTLNNDFSQLSSTPDSAALQQQTVADAQTFAQSMNTLGTTITSLRNSAQTGIATAVSTINTQLQQIATLNTEIASQQNQGQSTADLEDQRDDAVSTLAQQMNISYYTNSNGVMVIQTPSGTPLADTTAHTLIFNQQTVGDTSSYPSSLSGIYVDSPSGTDIAADPTSLGGTLGGLLQLRDQILPQQQAEADELSEQTANRFAAQGLKLFTQSDGTIPSNTNTAGSPSPYTGFASNITVNPAVVANPLLVQQGTTTPVPPATTLQPGDNTIINNVLNYTFGVNSDSSGTPNVAFNTTNLGASGAITSPITGATTLEDYSQQMLTNQANQASEYTSQSSFSASYQASLSKSLSDQSGVNLDTEVSNLTIYEHSYGASAQIIQTVDKLMDDLMSAVSGS